MEHLRIEPIDILHLRGNRLFAESGDAAALMPPWPSVFAGALRTRMLADAGQIEAFVERKLEGPLASVIGPSCETPGSFQVRYVALERTPAGQAAQLWSPLPADLIALSAERDRDSALGKGSDRRAPHEIRVERLQLHRCEELCVAGSFPLPCTPVLRTSTQEKPVSGIWVSCEGLGRYQRGGTPGAEDLVWSRDLWRSDPRLGIAVSSTSRTAREGLLFTSEAVSLCPGVAFVVGVSGANGVLPREGLLRLGGDGRGARVSPWERLPTPAPWEYRPSTDRFFFWLVTPGLFPQGWLPPGAEAANGKVLWRCQGLEAELVCAAVPRAEVISGWDLALKRPKPARRAVPAGAVYWFERRSGDLKDLGVLLDQGLWALLPEDWERSRRAEGFNNVWLGEWGREPNPSGEE